MSLVTDTKAMIDGGPDKETVLYAPYQGIPRNITALIDRNPLEIDFALEGGAAKSVRQVTLVNSATDGVAVPQLGKDEMHFKDSLCDVKDSIFKVTELVSQDPGMIVLQVTR